MPKSLGTIVLCLSLTSIPALAGEGAASSSVYYGDLNLSQETDRDALKSRLVTAADTVCDQIADKGRVLGQREKHKACVAKTIDTAMTSLRRDGAFDAQDAPLVASTP